MRGGGTMTCLATDADLRVSRVERVRRGVVPFAHRRRVTVGAHVVPVVLRARPMKRIGMRCLGARREREPVLPALNRGTRIPSHGERLKSPARKSNEILL